MLINKKVLEYYIKNGIIYKTLDNDKAFEDYTFYELIQTAQSIDEAYETIADVLKVSYINNSDELDKLYVFEGFNQKEGEDNNAYALRIKRFKDLECFTVVQKDNNEEMLLCVNPFDERIIGLYNNLNIVLVSSETFTNALQIKNKDQYLLIYEEDIKISIFVEKVLETATTLKASDIKLLSFPTDVKIKFNIDGKWGKWLGIIPKTHKNQFFSAVATMGDKTYVNGMSFDFDVMTNIKNKRMLWRINIAHTIDGGSMVLRSDSVDSKIPTLKELGFTDTRIEILSKIYNLHNGMVLITGGTRQGKTYTMNSLVNNLANVYGKDVAMLGNPIEKRIPNVALRQLKTDATDYKYNITFESFLSDQLRSNNDVIALVEARNSEQANGMFSFAITDHLVLATIHTDSFIATLVRLTEIMKVPHSIVGDTLETVVSQRLLEKLCPKCKIKIENGEYIANEKGCSHCNNGFSGEQLVNEIVALDKRAKIMISENEKPYKIYDYLVEENLVESFQDSLKEAKKLGLIDSRKVL